MFIQLLFNITVCRLKTALFLEVKYNYMFRLAKVTIIRVNIKRIQRKVLVRRLTIYDLKLRSRQYCIMHIKRTKKVCSSNVIRL